MQIIEKPSLYSCLYEVTLQRLSTTGDKGRPWLESIVDGAVELFQNALSVNTDKAETGEKIVEELLYVNNTIVEQFVPIYTHNLWEIFVTLTAYRFAETALTETGYDVTHDCIDQLPSVTLYYIATKLFNGILQMIAADYDEQE